MQPAAAEARRGRPRRRVRLVSHRRAGAVLRIISSPWIEPCKARLIGAAVLVALAVLLIPGIALGPQDRRAGGRRGRHGAGHADLHDRAGTVGAGVRSAPVPPRRRRSPPAKRAPAAPERGRPPPSDAERSPARRHPPARHGAPAMPTAAPPRSRGRRRARGIPSRSHPPASPAVPAAAAGRSRWAHSGRRDGRATAGPGARGGGLPGAMSRRSPAAGKTLHRVRVGPGVAARRRRAAGRHGSRPVGCRRRSSQND